MLGPRNKRRLAQGAIGLGPIAAAVAVVLLTRSPTHVGNPVSAGSRHPYTIIDIYSGMSKAQVLGLVGQPATRRGSCWLYHTNEEVRGGHLDAVNVCFFAAHVSGIRLKENGKWVPPAPTRVNVG